MKHRIFVKLAVAATAGMYLPGVGCKPNDKRLRSMLSQPHADPRSMSRRTAGWSMWQWHEYNQTALRQILSCYKPTRIKNYYKFGNPVPQGFFNNDSKK